MAQKLNDLKAAKEALAKKDSEITMLRKESEWMKRELRNRNEEIKAIRSMAVYAKPGTEEETGTGDTESLACLNRHSVTQAGARPLHWTGAVESSFGNNRHTSHTYPVGSIEPIQAPVLFPTSQPPEPHCPISFRHSALAPARRVSPIHAYPNCSRSPWCRTPVPCGTWPG